MRTILAGASALLALTLAACSPPDKSADESMPADAAAPSTDGMAMTPSPTESTTTAGPA